MVEREAAGGGQRRKAGKSPQQQIVRSVLNTSPDPRSSVLNARRQVSWLGFIPRPPPSQSRVPQGPMGSQRPGPPHSGWPAADSHRLPWAGGHPHSTTGVGDVNGHQPEWAQPGHKARAVPIREIALPYRLAAQKSRRARLSPRKIALDARCFCAQLPGRAHRCGRKLRADRQRRKRGKRERVLGLLRPVRSAKLAQGKQAPGGAQSSRRWE